MQKNAEGPLSDTTNLNLNCPRISYHGTKEGEFDIPPPLAAIPKSPILSYSGSVSSSYDSNAENFLALFSDNMPSTPATVCQESIPESPHPDQWEDLEELWKAEEAASFSSMETSFSSKSCEMEDLLENATNLTTASSETFKFSTPNLAPPKIGLKENNKRMLFQPKQENWLARNQPAWRVGLSKRTKVDPLHSKLKRRPA